jgi:hypothetical protein
MDRKSRARAVGTYSSRGPFAVAPAFEQTRRDQRIETAREHIRRNPEDSSETDRTG